MKWLIKILFFFLMTGIILPQADGDFICAPVDEDPYGAFGITGGKYKPSRNGENEYFRILVAFIQFQEDNSSANDWQAGTLPGWANSFVDSYTSGQYTDKTFSDYWNEMAVGDFDVIGSVFPELIVLPTEASYANAGKNFSHTNLDALEIIDNWIPAKGQSGVNWSLFDNWEYDPGTQTYVFSPGNADGYIDMILMIYRNATYKINPNDPDEKPGEWFGGGWGAFDGAATLGNISFEYETNDGFFISSGGGWVSAEGSGITFRTGGPNGKMNTLGLLGGCPRIESRKG